MAPEGLWRCICSPRVVTAELLIHETPTVAEKKQEWLPTVLLSLHPQRCLFVVNSLSVSNMTQHHSIWIQHLKATNGP